MSHIPSTPTDLSFSPFCPFTKLLKCHSFIVQKKKRREEWKIRRAVTGKLRRLFIHPLTCFSHLYFAHLFSGFFDLYTNNISYYSVRKWENQLKHRLFSSLATHPNAFCEANINLRSIPFGLFTEWTGKETGTKKNSISIQADYYQESFSNWLHFDFASVSNFSPRDLFGNEVPRRRGGERRLTLSSWRIFCLVLQSLLLRLLQKSIEIGEDL